MVTILRGNDDSSSNDYTKHLKPIAIYGFLALVALILFFGSYFTIPAGYCGVMPMIGSVTGER